MTNTNCGCSPTTGACSEHARQSRIASSVADAVSEADEVALARVIDALGAVEVAPGRYAWVLNDGAVRSRYVVATADALRTIRLDGICPQWPTNEATGDPDNRGVLMPAWWSLVRRKALRCKGCGAIVRANHCTGIGVERIAASLETGEEVPA